MAPLPLNAIMMHRRMVRDFVYNLETNKRHGAAVYNTHTQLFINKYLLYKFYYLTQNTPRAQSDGIFLYPFIVCVSE